MSDDDENWVQADAESVNRTDEYEDEGECNSCGLSYGSHTIWCENGGEE